MCLTAWRIPNIGNIKFCALVSAEGFEPSTHALEGRCSIQLSYAPILEFGAGDRTRTYNLLITSQLLYQLSHTSILAGITGLEPVTQ